MNTAINTETPVSVPSLREFASETAERLEKMLKASMPLNVLFVGQKGNQPALQAWLVRSPGRDVQIPEVFDELPVECVVVGQKAASRLRCGR